MRRFYCATLIGFAVFGFASVASAADLPVKAPVAPVAAPYSWTGFYVGANIGGGWGSRDVDFSPNDPLMGFIFGTDGASPPATSFRSSGVIGGLQLGYNWQFNRNWLLGLETDFDWSGMKGSASNTFSAPLIGRTFGATVDEQVKWFGTVRARLGYLTADNLLAYVTGGFAYGKVQHSGNYAAVDGIAFSSTGFGFSFNCAANSICFAGSSSVVATGWTLGGGLEYAIWQRWTLKAEYLYVSLDSKSVTETALAFTPGNAPASFNANYNRTSFNVAHVGVNYRF